MYVFVVGMERCGTHSVANIVNHACTVPHHVVHEEPPFLCREAKLMFEEKDYRTADLKTKVRRWSSLHRKNKLVCEANHRLGYFVTFLARQFRDSKFIFLFRDPIATIVSRISIWSHYPEHENMYPEFYREKIKEFSNEFNRFRITPPNSYSPSSLADIYAWEWLENYKFARKELACVPVKNRLLMPTESITPEFARILEFIGMNYFKIDGGVVGWSRVKSDSVYAQRKEAETDVFVTNNRDYHTDQTAVFARDLIKDHRAAVVSKILGEVGNLSGDDDLLWMDKRIANYLNVKMA